MGDFTDRDCEELLQLLHKYLHDTDTLQGGLEDLTITALAEDLAMSMDYTTDNADRYRREIEEALTWKD